MPMSQRDELIKRLLSKPKDFEIRELDRLMSFCGCERDNAGKTSGSAVKYFHRKDGKIFMCHRPHPGNILKPYVVSAAIAFLKDIGEIQGGKQ